MQKNMKHKYIVEVIYIDNLNRCRKKEIAGVFSSEDAIEKFKNTFVNKTKKYNTIFSVHIESDLFDTYSNI